MTMTAAAALGALMLAASAAPALAGGYWDGGIVQSGPPGAPPPGYQDGQCPCYCPRDRADYGDRGDDRRAWSDQRDDNAWRDDGARFDDGAAYDEPDDYGPADYADDGYGGGPGYVGDENDGGFIGGGFVPGVNIEFRDRFRDHGRFGGHGRRMVRPDDRPPTQHQGYAPHAGGRPPTHSGGHRR